MHAFCARVVSEAEIFARVESIATGLGQQLDAAWAAYCARLAGDWNALIRSAARPLDPAALAAALGEDVRAELRRTIQSAVAAGRPPAVGETLESIGKAAVLLLPLAGRGPAGLAVAVPVFVLLAARPIWDFLAARLGDSRTDCQAAISAQLAGLGNRVGAEFDREVRRRLTALHQWRERALTQAAGLTDFQRWGMRGGRPPK